ncbi:nucleotidyltransferase domain-containing protein [Polyangium jinanense]|uniref:Nucleotidyltransferase domain-containing protein n=1 Tax=Polyangium jinanense TaxID=2829994 RepID=A0A9X4AQB9_9BACT|nr:nucleotidyltransferase domain-containing protein [Polyangium jinanense]MDC3954641.1 nucleotidyltransferase domain-containing protein [Polyangium jinanense]MDC3980944.1 nucleotidyltransferase domain-containing protein [Polyangium jinanense]
MANSSEVLAHDPLLARLVNELVTRHGCHTVVLYGSRALGAAAPESDWDMLGIRAEGEATRDARLVDGVFLDAFIVPEKDVVDAGANFLHVRGGVAVLDPRGLGARLVEDAAAALALPPKGLPEAEIQARRAWCWKMLGRIRRGGPADVEAHYRRVWLLFDLLELYFVFRGRHFLGPKESFRWLHAEDLAAHAAFSAALAPGAPVEVIEALVERVLEV